MLNNVVKITRKKKSDSDDKTKEVRKLNSVIGFSEMGKSALRGSSVF